MSFLQFIRILWARRVMIGTATLACVLAATLIAFLLPTRYEAASRIELDIIKPDPVTGEVIQSNSARAYVATQQELIRDYRTAGAVVDQLGWTSSPGLAAQYEASGAAATGTDFRRWLASLIIDNTESTLIAGSNILEITYRGANPEAAARIADTIRAAFIEQNSVARRSSARGNAEFFERQLGEIRQRLTAAEQTKAAWERQNNVVLADDLTDPEVTRLQSLAGAPPPAPVVTPGQTITTPPPATAPSAGALAALDAQIATSREQLGPNHPQMEALRQQRAALQSQVSRELASSSQVARTTTTAPTVSGGVDAATAYRQQQAKVLQQRDKVDEARRLAQDVAVLRDQYATTAERAAQLGQQAEARETGLNPLGDAVPPDSPAFPNRPLIIGGSLLLGLALGVLAALVTELLRRRIRGEEDLALAGLPVLGAMPRPA